MYSGRLMMGVAVAGLLATGARADLAISSKATQNVSCSNGLCTATASHALLNAGDLATMLASGDVMVKTGGGASNIVVKAGVSWTSTSRLTLDAHRSVSINKPVNVTGTGAVAIVTNKGGSGGDLMFDGKGNIKFWDTGSSLVINGNSYTLVKDIATLASDIAANASGFYALAKDYDASVDGTFSSAPITTTFSGTFEGLGHGIDGLTIAASGHNLGLFSAVTGLLRDVQITNASVTGDTDNVGMLVAVARNATIVNCSASGTINLSGTSEGGGLVSGGSGTLTRSHADVAVHITGSATAGGLVGGSGFDITDAYATGNISGGDESFLGGLVGKLGEVGVPGTVSHAFATGTVSGGENSTVGGLVGSSSSDTQTDNSYATGAVSGGKTANVAGFAGAAAGKFYSSYATGHVAGGKSGISSGLLGALGQVDYALDYWDIDTTGKGKGSGCGATGCGHGAKGLTTEEFQSGLPAGFDPAIWGEQPNINGGYPYLLALPPT